MFLKRAWAFFKQEGGQYRNLNPMDANRVTHKRIQTPTPGENDHVKANQGGNETDQVSGDNQRTDATINSQLNTRAATLQEPMRV